MNFKTKVKFCHLDRILLGFSLKTGKIPSPYTTNFRNYQTLCILNETNNKLFKCTINPPMLDCVSKKTRIFQKIMYSNNINDSNPIQEKTETKLSKKEQLKKAVKDYGSTVIVFHVTISLASLGFFYVLVSSGIDMEAIVKWCGINFKFVENAGTFVTAYAIHKLFAPVRISITLGATPFIVRYLRNKGILKKPS